MLYYGLISPLLSCGIAVWEHGAKALTRIVILQRRAVRHTAGLNHLELCRNSFIYLKILRVSILYVKEKCDCTVNEQINTYNTRNNKDYHKYGQNLELYNSKPSVVGCIFYNKLTRT
jgi:hypothetical protein